jgi:hypothetical protein
MLKKASIIIEDIKTCVPWCKSHGYPKYQREKRKKKEKKMKITKSLLIFSYGSFVDLPF